MLLNILQVFVKVPMYTIIKDYGMVVFKDPHEFVLLSMEKIIHICFHLKVFHWKK